MKKRFSILLTVAVTAALLAGCGSTSTPNSPDDTGSAGSVSTGGSQEGDVSVKDGKAVSVKLGDDYSTDNGTSFNLFKVVTSGKLQSVSGQGSYYEADNGYNFIDVVLNLTNNGTEDISVSDDMTGYFESSDGTQYNNPLIAVEDRDDHLTEYNPIKPLATSKVHIGYKVPNNITTGTAYFSIMGELYSVDYDASVDISSKTSVSMNQEITVDDVASFELLGTNYTADVLPPNTSGFYTHYPIDDPSNNVYFVVYCNLTNYSSSAIGADDMISIKAVFDGKYEYTANMVLEAKDGTGFDYASITSIDPLETRKGVFMFDIPKKVQDMNCELSIYFYGNEYSFNG